MNDPLLYVSKPKVEIKKSINKATKRIDNKLILQLDELYRMGRNVLCEFKINGRIYSGIFKMEDNQIYLTNNDINTKFELNEIEEINVLKI